MRSCQYCEISTTGESNGGGAMTTLACDAFISASRFGTHVAKPGLVQHLRKALLTA
jgi:hypothetical protein